VPIGLAPVAVAAGDRWLLAFSLATLAVLAVGSFARRVARTGAARARRGEAPSTPGVRRRAGVVIVLGPVIGFATSPTLGEHTLLVVGGAVALAVVGVQVERRPEADRLVAVAIVVAAALAVAFGVRFGPTGVGVVDALGALVLIAFVTGALDGLGTADGLAPGVGAAAAFGVFALAGFAGQGSLAAVAAGLGGACLAFLAFNLRPASLFVGRGGRLAIGYAVAVGALSVRLPVGPAGRLFVPLILLGFLVLDALIVLVDRLQRRRALFERRGDHVLHRLVALGWPAGWPVTFLGVVGLALALVALFVGRGVLSVWVGVALAAILLLAVGGEAARGQLEREPPRGLSRRARVVVSVVGVAVVLGIVPTVAAMPNVRSTMERGRAAAARALAAARAGDDAGADLGFRQAAAAFDEAHSKLAGATLAGGLLVPGLAPNLRAARTLADVGRELAHAGERVTETVDPASLHVVDGRLPLDEVRRVAPALRDGARILDQALATLRSIDDPYLLPVVSDTLHRIESQMAQSTGEAQRAAAAAQLGPTVFGANGPRTYLLVVQNNAELRATGGLIGDWALMTAVDGKVSVGPLQKTSIWNTALASIPHPRLDAPADYHRRYDHEDPQHALQNVNLSPDFPTVGRALMSLAPQAGLPHLDGVLAVDPLGLAALLQLTGPVSVAGWPEDINSANVVSVTLRDAYTNFFGETARTDFLGDVAKVVVDNATSGDLGAPARIAQVLGGAAHEGHLLLAFARPSEQRLAAELNVAGGLAPVRSDALAVNTQNAAGNKIDYYLQRQIEYHVQLNPDPGGRTARVTARLTISLNNTAPASGLPQIVIGPYAAGYVAGVNRSWVTVYSPLGVQGLTLDGTPTTFSADPEAGRDAYSKFIDIPATTTSTLEFDLAGRLRLGADGWYELDLGHQPTLAPDRVQVSVDVPAGWEVADAPGLVRPFDQRASGVVLLGRDHQLRVRIARKPAPLDLWGHLQAGR
jgi:UDP-N-acetylmuramyl pentapeptide phosphotransferase/UDP-N-acetylglucosamine-1-phosphate transferase